MCTYAVYITDALQITCKRKSEKDESRNSAERLESCPQIPSNALKHCPQFQPEIMATVDWDLIHFYFEPAFVPVVQPYYDRFNTKVCFGYITLRIF